MLWSIIKCFLLIWIIVLIVFLFFQRKLIYIPNKQIVHLTHYDQSYIQIIRWKNPSGIELFGFYRQAQESFPTIIFFHGNAGNIAGRKPLLYLLSEIGYGVFMPEYRGYGGIAGRPSEQGLYEDAQSAITILLRQYVKDNDIILMGESLGTGVALEMAQRFKVKAVILQAPFLDLNELRDLHYPYIKLPLLDKYQNFDKIKDIEVPILILHGSADKIVPYCHGQRLYELAVKSACRELKTFENGTHQLPWNDIFIQSINNFIQCINNSSQHH